MLISYASNGEDVVFDRVFGHLRAGTYLDLGSGDGRASLLLDETGWRGVLVGLDSASDSSAASGRRHSLLLSADASPEEISGAVESLGVSTLDVLRIGASHLDQVVLGAVALARWQPRVVVVERQPEELEGGPLAANGYEVGGFDGVNSYLARSVDADTLSRLYPACSRDDYVTAEVVAIRAELAHVQSLLAAAERAGEHAPGGDRAVLSAPSSQRRRYASRHVMVHTPVITLDRVAVVDLPECGGGHLGVLLASALEVELLHLAHPADVTWAELPERVVIALSAPFSELLRIRLVANGFRVVVIARDPLEQELSRQSLVSASVPSAAEFISEAVSAEAASGLELASRWLVEPGTVRIEFAKMRVDIFAVLIRLFDELGVGIEDVATFARRLSGVATELQRRLDDLSALHVALSSADVAAFATAHSLVLERLGLDGSAWPGPGTDGDGTRIGEVRDVARK